MKIADSIINTATEVFEATARKSVYFAQIARLNVKISGENASLKDLYTKLGKAYFEGIETGESESALFARELCEKIVVIRGRIDDMKAEIDRLKDEDQAASEAAAAARAAKEAEAGQPVVEDEVEITIEVPLKQEEIDQEAPQPPIVNLYVDESQSSPNRE